MKTWLRFLLAAVAVTAIAAAAVDVAAARITPPPICKRFPDVGACKRFPPPAPEPLVTLDVVGDNLVLRATGLTPGTGYEFTYEIFGCGNPVPYVLGGGTGTVVREDGTFTIGFLAVEELEYYRAPAPLCTVNAWLRPVGSRVYDVATYPDGTPISASHDFA